MSDDFVDEIERRDELVLLLGGRNRRQRQEAAHELAGIARADSTLVVEVVDDLIAALEVSEAQTRWECLDALSEVVQAFPQCVEGAFDGAEESLFDEGSASARLAAFRFLSLYGSQSPEVSLRAWPLIREAVQCYHGDAEYRDMLICLLGFARVSRNVDLHAVRERDEVADAVPDAVIAVVTRFHGFHFGKVQFKGLILPFDERFLPCDGTAALGAVGDFIRCRVVEVVVRH